MDGWKGCNSSKTKFSYFLSTDIPRNFHSFLLRKLQSIYSFLEIFELADKLMIWSTIHRWPISINLRIYRHFRCLPIDF